MNIESDEEYEALVRRALLACYSHYPEAERIGHVERAIPSYLEEHRKIRKALAELTPLKWDAEMSYEFDRALLEFSVYRIQNEACLAFGITEAHRIWDVLRTAIGWARQDENSRIAAKIRADVEKNLGPTASSMIFIDHDD